MFWQIQLELVGAWIKYIPLPYKFKDIEYLTLPDPFLPSLHQAIEFSASSSLPLSSISSPKTVLLMHLHLACIHKKNN